MTGYTDSITLVSPSLWWPSFGTLSDHPLDPTRTFSAAVTTGEAALGAEALSLSKLGRATFLGAQWVEQGRSVAVVNVFSGETIILNVDRGDRSSDVRHDAKSLSLYELAMNNRIRIAPTRPEEAARSKGPSSVGTSGVREYLLQPHVSAMWNSTREDLCHGTSCGSVLLWSTGGDGEELLLLEYATEQLPTFFLLNGRQHLVEFRSVDLSQLLALEAREAAAVIRCALRPPPVPRDDKVRHVICVTLRHAKLLGGTTNVHTTVVCSELCHGIDAFCVQQNKNMAMMVWSAATDPKQIPISLRARLSGRQVCVGKPSVEECASCLRHLLEQTAAAPHEEQTIEAAAERMSSLALKEILHLTPADAEKLCSASDERSEVDSLAPYKHLFGVGQAIEQLESLLVWPLSHLRSLQALRVPCTKGALLYGPTGCGKTAVMSALAQRLRWQGDSSGLHIMLVDGLSLIDKEVGRTEKNIVEKFEEARSRSPTVLFLDNLDALAAPRGQTTTETNVVGDRSLSTLLTEMDGVSNDPQRVVVVVASAPSPAALDPAVCRPGRLDVHIALSKVDGACAAAHLREQLKQFARRLLSKGNTAGADVVVSCCDQVIDEHVSALVASRPSMSAATVAALCREMMIAALSSACSDGGLHPEEEERQGRVQHVTDEKLSVILKDVFTAVV